MAGEGTTESVNTARSRCVDDLPHANNPEVQAGAAVPRPTVCIDI